MFTFLSEKGEILGYVSAQLCFEHVHTRYLTKSIQQFCQSGAGAEFGGALAGYRRRCDALGVSYPEMAVADNCCQVEAAVKTHFPQVPVKLDVYHCIMR